MMIGIGIMVVSIINLAYLAMGGVITTDYLVGFFLGGFIWMIGEILLNKFVSQEKSAP